MSSSRDPQESLIVIGNFDGVHRGHQAVLAEAARIAHERGLRARVMTFDPHPAEVLARRAPSRLTRIERRVELIGRVDASLETVVQRFDKAFADLSPRAFAERIAGPGLRARHVVVGQNFRFGKNRSGDLTTLKELGQELGFQAEAHRLLGDDTAPWSSTRVRAAIQHGDVAEAADMLGRPHSVQGRVIEGDQRGRTLGFPTANLGEVIEALPGNGVYAATADRIDIETGKPTALGLVACNIGIRPTVGGDPAPRLEAHVLGFSGDLYGARLRIYFVRKLRDETKFPSLDALKAQIGEDVATAKRALEQERPHGAAYDR